MNDASAPQGDSPLVELLGVEPFERLSALDAIWSGDSHLRKPQTLNQEASTHHDGHPCQFDVAIVGGGLSLLFAPLLARRGLRVVVLERAREGTPHREWNASHNELLELCRLGLLSPAQLDAIVVARYDRSLCRWHGLQTQWMDGILDCAVDAHALWHLTKDQAADAGVQIWQGTAVTQEVANDDCVTLTLHQPAKMHHDAPNRISVRAMVDARGASSPYARGDLACPTVGGVLEGLDEGQGEMQINPHVGEVLVTTEGVQEGRQHLWEAFPGRRGQVAVYLFYYAERHRLERDPLKKLYGRFVTQMGRYKTGKWRMVRPTFGIIPGHSRLHQQSVSPHARIVLVGDAAGRQSPLTFCGFGAMLRSLGSATEAIATAVQGKKTPAHVVDDAPIHQVTGALALMLARASRSGPNAMNALLNAAFATLEADGQCAMNKLLQDRMSHDEAIRFLWRVGLRHRGVWPAVYRQLGIRDASLWAWRMRRPILRLPTL